MDGVYTVGKSKRKELDEFNCDFSDFSLSSPARKIRRLDADLPPIIEEEELVTPLGSVQFGHKASGGSNISRGVVIEELPAVQENEERALVVFKPTVTPLVRSPSDFTLSVDPLLISGFKNQLVWPNQRDKLLEVRDIEEHDKDAGAPNKCLAVVLWAPSQIPSATGGEAAPQSELPDMMEAEEMEGVTMDIEDDYGVDHRGGMNLNEGLHQWQQQHCLVPQPPQNTSTPLVWYR